MGHKDIYINFGAEEHHFNNLQRGIRNLASAWLLAAFAGLVVLFQTEGGAGWLVPRTVLLVCVAFMATMGLFVLWINDLMVYQRLLNAVFLTGLRWEFENNTYPPVRAMMMVAAEGRSKAKWLTLFYAIPMWAFLAVSAVSSALMWNGFDPDPRLSMNVWTASVCALMTAQLTVLFYVQFKKRKMENRERPELFGNAAFSSMFTGDAEGNRRLRAMIARHVPPAACASPGDGAPAVLVTKHLPHEMDYFAPDGSEIRRLPDMTGGGLCECTLPAGSVSQPRKHRSVEEIWYFLEGVGEVWRKAATDERLDAVVPGMALTIPPQASFQFRNTGTAVLRFMIVTMPPWPGKQEALDAERKWEPTINGAN